MKFKFLLLTSMLTTSAVFAQEAVSENEQVWKLWSPDLWTGSIEAGADIQNGNTDRRAFNVGVSGKRETEEWVTSAYVRGKMVRENKVRTEEKYEVGMEGSYKLNPKSFVFGDVDYVNDSFSGLEYRLSETIGLGHNLYNTENFKWDIKGSVGARHSLASTAGADRQDEAIFKPATNLSWKISESLSFEEHLKSTIGSEFVVTESVTSLKNKLAENWYLKLSLDVEHVDNVEPGKKHTDTSTLLNVVYDF